MKKRILILLVSLAFISFKSFAQEDQKDYIWSYEGKKKEHTLGLYGGLYGSYSQISSDPVGYLGYRAAVVFDKKWGLGLAGYALWYDKALNEITETGNYHLMAGYNGLLVEYIQSLGNRFKINYSIISGAGLVKYEYDTDEKERPWHEEIIDQDFFAVFEPGIEFQTRLGRRSWIGINGTYRNTSPIKMMQTEENLLRNYTVGISYKWGVF